MKCKECGAEVKAGTNFCPDCGAKMPKVKVVRVKKNDESSEATVEPDAAQVADADSSEDAESASSSIAYSVGELIGKTASQVKKSTNKALNSETAKEYVGAAKDAYGKAKNQISDAIDSVDVEDITGRVEDIADKAKDGVDKAKEAANKAKDSVDKSKESIEEFADKGKRALISKKTLIIVVICIVAIVAIVAIGFAASIYGSRSENNDVAATAPQVETYPVAITAGNAQNIFFNVYSVNIYIDGYMVGTVDNGKKAEFNIELVAGGHTLDVVAVDDGSEKDDRRGSHDFETTEEESVMTFVLQVGFSDISFNSFSVMTKAEAERLQKEKEEQEAKEEQEKQQQEAEEQAQKEALAEQKAAEEAAEATKTALVHRLKDYALYYLLDFNTMTVRYFSTTDTGVQVGTFSGDLDSGIDVTWPYDGGSTENLRRSGSRADSVILTGFDGSKTVYDIIKSKEAEDILSQPGYHDIAS